GITGAFVERDRGIQPQGPERCVVANADTRSEPQLLNPWKGVGGNISAVNETDSAEIIAEPGTRFNRSFEQIASARYPASAIIDADGAEPVSAHRSAAAGEK